VAPIVTEMARRLGCEIVVMHVVDLPPSMLGAPEAAAWSALINADRLRASARVALESFIQQEFPGAQTGFELAEGDVATQIVDYARDDPATLIAMPTHGYSPFRAFLLGSVTSKVLHDTLCPVWTGVHTQEIVAHPPARWHRMLCAVDTDGGDLRVLRWAAEFATAQNADLKIVHAVPGTNETASEDSVPRTYRFLFDAAREHIANMQALAGTELELCLLGGRAGPVVRAVAAGYDADLVVIGRGVMQKTLGRLRSRAYEIIREAPCPVISV
jgi:nucleotide-binding universal stress UspA family protein